MLLLGNAQTDSAFVLHSQMQKKAREAKHQFVRHQSETSLSRSRFRNPPLHKDPFSAICLK